MRSIPVQHEPRTILSTMEYTGRIGQLGGRMPLTELQIKRLAAREGRYAVSDGRGLALEMMPTGATSWRYRYQLNGKTEKVSLGSAGRYRPAEEMRSRWA